MVEKMPPGQLVLDALLLHLDHPRLPPLELGVQRPDHLPNRDHHNVQSHLFKILEVDDDEIIITSARSSRSCSLSSVAAK